MRSSSSPFRVLLGAFVLVFLVSVAKADIMELKDGQIFHGVKMSIEKGYVVLHYKHGDVKVPLSRVSDYAIDGAPPIQSKTRDNEAERAKGLVPYHGRWVSPRYRKREFARELAKKKKEIEEYAAHRTWANPYKFETEHFRFHSTLPERINDKYKKVFEAYYREFTKNWHVAPPRGWGKLDVYFYRDHQNFSDRSGAHGGIEGYYRFIPPREIDFFYDSSDPGQTTAILLHEMTHYMTNLINVKFAYPHWISEAMAEYYGGSRWDPKRKKLTIGGIQQGRLVEVLTDMAMGKKLALKDLISSESDAYEHYYWGWSFVYFMMKSKRYSRRFKEFYWDLGRARYVKRKPFEADLDTVSGKECMKVFEERLGIHDLAKLQKEWYAFIKKLPCSNLKGLELAGISAFEHGYYRFRGPRLLKDAIKKGSRNVKVYFCYAQCLEFKGDSKGALAMYEKACQIDPVDPDTWAYRGLELMQDGQKKKGKDYLALANEIDPERDYRDLEIAVQAVSGGDWGR